jgi:hypothetical protein
MAAFKDMLMPQSAVGACGAGSASKTPTAQALTYLLRAAACAPFNLYALKKESQ